MTAEITFPLAVLAGLLSFVSPCVLPLMPVYLSYLTGVTVAGETPAGRHRVVAHALAFIVGFALVFILIGATVGLVAGGFVRTDFSTFVSVAGGILLITFALHMLRTLDWLARRAARWPGLSRRLAVLQHTLDRWILPERRFQGHAGERPGYLRSSMVGMGFAAGWSPCVGPLLAAILTLAMNAAVGPDLWAAVAKSSLYLAFYALGLAIPFLLTAVVLERASAAIRRLNRYGHLIERISAAFLIAVGVLLISGSMGQLNQYFNITPEWIYDLEERWLSS